MATTARVKPAQRVADETECPRHLALHAVDALFAALRERVLSGDRIEVRGFGALCVKQARARLSARNPTTSEAVRVPAWRKLQLKPGQALREGLRRPRAKGESERPACRLDGCPVTPDVPPAP